MKKIIVLLFIIVITNLCATLGFVVNSGSSTLTKIDFDTEMVDNSFCALGSSANRVALTEDFAYVVNSGDNNLQKIDIEDGQTVSYIYFGSSTNPYDIIIEDNFAYVSGGLSNEVYKVDLISEEIEDSVPVGLNPAGMTILNEKLYVGNTDYTSYENCSVSIIDLFTFEEIASIPTEPNPQFLTAINGLIHISCGGNWNDITGKICILDPSINEIINVLDIGSVTSNFAQTCDNVVYVGDGYANSLFAYDSITYEIIYDSTNPFTPGGSMVTSNEENLFVLGGEWGQNFSVKVFDFNENLQNEYLVGLYSTDLKLIQENVSVDDEQISTPNHRVYNYPNPFNPSGAGYSPITKIHFSLPKPSKVNVSIYNTKGQRVKHIPCEYFSSGQNVITWDGTNDSKKPVASGLYLYRLAVDNQIFATSKMLLLRK